MPNDCKGVSLSTRSCELASGKFDSLLFSNVGSRRINRDLSVPFTWLGKNELLVPIYFSKSFLSRLTLGSSTRLCALLCLSRVHSFGTNETEKEIRKRNGGKQRRETKREGNKTMIVMTFSTRPCPDRIDPLLVLSSSGHAWNSVAEKIHEVTFQLWRACWKNAFCFQPASIFGRETRIFGPSRSPR